MCLQHTWHLSIFLRQRDIRKSPGNENYSLSPTWSPIQFLFPTLQMESIVFVVVSACFFLPHSPVLESQNSGSISFWGVKYSERWISAGTVTLYILSSVEDNKIPCKKFMTKIYDLETFSVSTAEQYARLFLIFFSFLTQKPTTKSSVFFSPCPTMNSH